MFALFRLDKKTKHSFLFLVALSFVYVFPIIQANYYYLDDWRRGMSGLAGWEFDGRPLTSWMMAAINFGLPLLDISPLPLLLGIVILSYALTLFSRKYNYIYAGNPFYTAATLFFFTANPFFLENLSFKYDSLSMCIALSLAVLIFSVDDDIDIKRLFIISAICIFLILNLYQPALCAFWCLLFMKFLFDIINKNKLKNIIASECILLLSCFISLLIYNLTTVYYYINSNNIPFEQWYISLLTYAKGHSSLININDINIFITNIINYIHLIGSYIKSLPSFLVIIAILLISIFIFSVIIIFLKNYFDICLCINKIVLFFIICSPIFIFLNTFLFMTIIFDPIVRCRVLLSFGCFMLLIGTSIIYISKFFRYCNLLLIPFLAFIFMLSFIYGNVMEHQKSFDLVFLQKLSYDLEKMNINDNDTKNLHIASVGLPPTSKQLQLAASRFPVLKNLFYYYYREDFPFFLYSLPCYVQQDYIIREVTNSNDMRYMLSSKPDVTNDLYSIYMVEKKTVIKFHHGGGKKQVF